MGISHYGCNIMFGTVTNSTDLRDSKKFSVGDRNVTNVNVTYSDRFPNTRRSALITLEARDSCDLGI